MDLLLRTLHMTQLNFDQNIYLIIFFCAGVVYSGEYDACDVTLSVYPHRTSFGGRAWGSHRGHGHIFQARPVWIYTTSNITSIIFDNACMQSFIENAW